MRFGPCVLVLAICGSLTLAPATVSRGAEAEKPGSDKPGSDKPGPGKPAVTSLPRLPAELHNALQGRDFADAVKLIDGLAADRKRTDVDYLLYLKGLALINLGQFDAALDTFAGLEREYPKSAWLSRSRFGRGAALAKQHNYQAAAAIYKAEAERLLSNGRKDELTGIYLESADRFFEGEVEKGPSTRKQP
ncbi:MAG TPA: tetratricopeptide repeat protein, partial [Pirellulaceae bacterium]|nr:tetratricopeptide repeat protein [Pirellulaceae bacterium]